MLRLATGLVVFLLAHVSRGQEASGDHPRVNLFGARARQSSTFSPGYEAALAIDKLVLGGSASFAMDSLNEKTPWLEIDMGGNVTVHEILVGVPYYMPDGIYPMTTLVDNQLCQRSNEFHPDVDGDSLFTCEPGLVTGRVLRIQMEYGDEVTYFPLGISSVRVYGYPQGELTKLLPIPKLNLIGLQSQQSSTHKNHTSTYVAAMANDGNPRTCLD